MVLQAVATIGVFVDQINRRRNQRDDNNRDDADHQNYLHMLPWCLIRA